ncbi:hypothetical protein MTR_6g023235 [Medicago truncatula]|uniref:Uncharacterized protein n=1 Tax=Medicago truncatula TaxID=3880 RepID=A0A072UI18_MEDTR|nr:hypothetical protein MTR_6g023235 [Medicago truncatula]
MKTEEISLLCSLYNKNINGNHHLKLTHNCEIPNSNPGEDVHQPNNIGICGLS